jgi:hypothetical protein
MGRGDFGFISAVRQDAELTMFGIETFRGREAWRQALTSWIDSLDGFHMEMSEFLDFGTGQVLLEVRLTGTGAASAAATPRGTPRGNADVNLASALDALR